MAANSNLDEAKKAKKDEFYTDYEVIQDELQAYQKHFRDKVVLCNCDDPKASKFFQYFAHNFYELGLKQLICTCYKNASGEEFYYERECKRVAKENQHKLIKDEKPTPKNINKNEKSCYFIYEGKDENGNELQENKAIDRFIQTLEAKPLSHDSTGGGNPILQEILEARTA